MKRIMLLLLIFVIGCSKQPIEVPVCYECPDCICKGTICPDCVCGDYDESYVEGLIRESKKCERSLYYYNISSCHDELNWTQEELQRVENKSEEDYQDIKWDYDECEDRIEVIDDELKDCNKDLCKYNESLC